LSVPAPPTDTVQVRLNITVRLPIPRRYIYLKGHSARRFGFIIWAMTAAFAPRHGSHG
jgi:hypothetical protein